MAFRSCHEFTIHHVLQEPLRTNFPSWKWKLDLQTGRQVRRIRDAGDRPCVVAIQSLDYAIQGAGHDRLPEASVALVCNTTGGSSAYPSEASERKPWRYDPKRCGTLSFSLLGQSQGFI